jgi:hypothetical protein
MGCEQAGRSPERVLVYLPPRGFYWAAEIEKSLNLSMLFVKDPMEK